MNTAKQVADLIGQWKAEGMNPAEIAWKAALACEGWPYVYGAWGAECTVDERKKRYRDAHPTIRTACKAYDGGTCSGCKWFPGGERVRCFDCRGFTDWVLKNAGVIDLQGEGATSQWNTASNWSAKGPIGTIPADTLVCLFVQKNGKMEHTGLGYNGETVECSSGVQHFTQRKAKWTHWAAPAGSEPVPVPDPDPDQKPTLRRGSKGEYVTLLQTMLLNKGYQLPKFGADGSFGAETETALKLFQGDHRLATDGVCGRLTWEALEQQDNIRLYSVTIPHLPAYKADALIASYDGATKTAEG